MNEYVTLRLAIRLYKRKYLTFWKIWLVEYSGSISATGKYNYFSSYFHNNNSLGRPYYQSSILDQVTG